MKKNKRDVRCRCCGRIIDKASPEKTIRFRDQSAKGGLVFLCLDCIREINNCVGIVKSSEM